MIFPDGEQPSEEEVLEVLKKKLDEEGGIGSFQVANDESLKLGEDK